MARPIKDFSANWHPNWYEQLRRMACDVLRDAKRPDIEPEDLVHAAWIQGCRRLAPRPYVLLEPSVRAMTMGLMRRYTLERQHRLLGLQRLPDYRYRRNNLGFGTTGDMALKLGEAEATEFWYEDPGLAGVDRRDSLGRYLSVIPDDMRSLLHDKIVLGKTLAQIARRKGVTGQTIGTRMRDAGIYLSSDTRSSDAR